MSFPRYQSYKESGVEWLEEVPEHWNICSFRFCLSNIFNGLTATQTDAGEHTVAVTRIETISKGRIDEERLGFVNKDDARKDRLLLVGDILFSNINSLNVIGNCAQYIGGREIYAGMNLLVLRPQNTINSEWLYYLVKSGLFRQVVESLSKPAINQASISQSSLLSIGVVVPPLPEQQTIAAFLDSETAKIDGLIAEQQRLIELLREKVTSLVLSSFSLSGTQKVRLGNVAKTIARPVIQREDELYTPIGLFNRGRGIFHKDPREIKDMGDSDFFWIEKGDLIISGQFAWEGAVALAGEKDKGCVVSHRYPVLRAIPEVALTEYLLALLSTKHGDFLLNESSRGAAGRNRPLNIGQLMKEKIPVPNIQMQEKIAKAVHLVIEVSQEINKQIEILKERRMTLTSAAVTGKINVQGVA